ncbi:MAG: sulfite exporter TauE/SafE family protein [Pseudomonadota bacterium]|nr:sulfite exporter TauE/SafE family protein [Pseudomonadota bacterium]
MDMLLVFLLAAGLSGGFVNGLAGFGTALFSLGWLLQVMPPQQAVAIALVCSLVTGVPGVWQVRHSIDRRRLALFILPAFAGIPIGTVLLGLVDTRLLSLLVGGMLLLYGGYFAFRRTLPAIEGNWTLVEAGIGFVGGVLGAMAGLSGALPSMWLALRPWPKAVQRGIMQPFSMVILLVATVLLALKGVFTPQVLYNLSLVLPASMFGAVIGLMLFRRMADALYPRVLIGLMLISGGTLLASTMLAGGA